MASKGRVEDKNSNARSPERNTCATISLTAIFIIFFKGYAAIERNRDFKARHHVYNWHVMTKKRWINHRPISWLTDFFLESPSIQGVIASVKQSNATPKLELLNDEVKVLICWAMRFKDSPFWVDKTDSPYLRNRVYSEKKTGWRNLNNWFFDRFAWISGEFRLERVSWNRHISSQKFGRLI